MLVLLLLFILYAISEGYEHARYPAIYHFRAVLRRIATGLVVCYAVCGVGGPLVLYLNIGFMLSMSFWICFDISRNLADGEDALYIGATSSIDKLLLKAPLVSWHIRFFLTGLSIVLNCVFTPEYLIRVTNLINITWLF